MIDMAKYNRLRKDLTSWAIDYRYKIIEALTAEGTYGAVKLDPQQQFSRFLEMHEVDYDLLVNSLNNKYRGLSDAQERVNDDLARFIDSMIGIALGEARNA